MEILTRNYKLTIFFFYYILHKKYFLCERKGKHFWHLKIIIIIITARGNVLQKYTINIYKY